MSSGLSPSNKPSFYEPIIDRIQTVHEKNLQKEFLVQKTKNRYLQQFQRRKNDDNDKRMKKNEQIMAKVQQQHQKLKQTIKRRDENLQKIYKKSQIMEEDRYRQKEKRIKERRLKHNKQRRSQIPQLEKDNSVIFSSSASTFAAKSFYQKAYNNQLQWSINAMSKNYKKQCSAEKNRKKIEQALSKLKEVNQRKLSKKIKSEEQQEEKYRFQLKKSVRKIESFLHRSFEIKENEKSAKKKKEERDRKHFEKVQKMRQNLLADIAQKFNRIDAGAFEKNMKFSNIRENKLQKSLEKKKIARQMREAKTQTKFHQNNKAIQERMDEIYKKDRQRWGFVTSVTAFKENLIEKNIYESSQVALTLKK